MLDRSIVSMPLNESKMSISCSNISSKLKTLHVCCIGFVETIFIFFQLKLVIKFPACLCRLAWEWGKKSQPCSTHEITVAV